MTTQSNLTVGAYVDVSNLNLSGGRNLQFSVLRRFACRDGAEALHLNAYLAYDPERAERDPLYQRRTAAFHHAIREQGFKVHLKPVEWRQGQGGRYLRSDADLDLALDALLQSRNLDRIVIASGDGDFTRLSRLLQERGCRVEVVGLDNVSPLLKRQANLYVTGYLIPGLVPDGLSQGRKERQESGAAWGEPGSRVRGWCWTHKTSERTGVFRFYRADRPALWGENDAAAFDEAVFGDRQLPEGTHPELLPNRSLLFEFGLAGEENNWRAVDIRLAGRPPANFFQRAVPEEAQPCLSTP